MVLFSGGFICKLWLACCARFLFALLCLALLCAALLALALPCLAALCCALLCLLVCRQGETPVKEWQPSKPSHVWWFPSKPARENSTQMRHPRHSFLRFPFAFPLNSAMLYATRVVQFNPNETSSTQFFMVSCWFLFKQRHATRVVQPILMAR